MKFGVALGALNPHFHLDAVDAAERLGFESVWLPEHLVFPVEMTRSPRPGEEHPPVPSTTPIFDAFTYLAFIAARTQRVRVGTHVYNVGLRHPFVSARAVATLDQLSGGRFEYGVGAGWLEQEWIAAGLDFASRGRRVDEILEVSQRLWTEATIEHHGEFFDFDAVAFEPKPMQSPWPPILVGGESEAALRRAARWGDGWIGMKHTFVHRCVADRTAADDAPRGRASGSEFPGLSGRNGVVARGGGTVAGAGRDATHRVAVDAVFRGRGIPRTVRRVDLLSGEGPPVGNGRSGAAVEEFVGMGAEVTDCAALAESDGHDRRLHRVADARHDGGEFLRALDGFEVHAASHADVAGSS